MTTLSPSSRSWSALELWAIAGAFLLPYSPFLAALAIVWVTVVLWHRQGKSFARSPLVRGFGLVAILTVASTLVAGDRLQAFWGSFNFLPFFFVFPALSTLMASPASLRGVARVWAIGSVPVALLGLGQLGLRQSISLKLGFLLHFHLEAGGSPPGRLSSIFFHANTCAFYLLVAFAIALGLWLEENRRERPYTRLGWWLLGAIALLQSVAIYYTHSRSGWGLAGAIALAYALYAGWHKLTAAIALMATAAFGSAFAPPPLQGLLRAIVPAAVWLRLTDLPYSDRPVALTRLSQWQFAARMARDRPVFGWGLRSFSGLYEQWSDLWLGHPHNLFLMLAAETGLPATLLLIGLVYWICCQGGRRLLQPLPQFPNADCRRVAANDRSIVFAYCVAFGACTLFHFFDIPLFDLRANLLGWWLLAGIWGQGKHASEGG